MRAVRLNKMSGRKRTGGAAIASVPSSRRVETPPPRLPGCPFLDLSPDELGELMSPTLDSEDCRLSNDAPGSGLSMPNYDHFLAVLGDGRWLGRAEAGKGVRHSLMVDLFDWS
jgi:hypothetical protein